MSLWLVRAGKHGDREQVALEQGCVVIGWDELPDLSAVSSREEVLKLLEGEGEEGKHKRHLNHAAQVWAFAHRINAGDLVALPLKTRSVIALGKVTGPYQYRTDLPGGGRHTRPVDWIGEYPRSAFDQDILYSFGAFMTVCRIKRNDAEERVVAILEGRKPPSPPPESEAEDDAAGAVAISHDLDEFARDQIRDFVSRKFRGHDLTRIVAAVLEAQGYKLHVSPAGPDGGVDIIAGRGPLGFDPPRLAVQVKSSDSAIDVKVLRELQGAMKNFGAEQGLFVSWGGFKSSVTKEAARIFFEIRLWDAGDVVKMVQAHYGQLSDTLQAELPLRRIWTIVQNPEGEDQ